MPTLLRRRLVVLMVLAAALLVVTFHITYKYFTGTDSIPSFMNEVLEQTHTTLQKPPAPAPETSPEISIGPRPVAPSKTLIVASTLSDNTDWIQREVNE